MFGTLIESYRSVFRGLPREVWILALVLLVNRSGTMVLPFLTLYLTTQMGYAPSEAGVFLALYGVGSVGGNALGGRLTDLVGYKGIQVTSLVGSGAKAAEECAARATKTRFGPSMCSALRPWLA